MEEKIRSEVKELFSEKNKKYLLSKTRGEIEITEFEGR